MIGSDPGPYGDPPPPQSPVGITDEGVLVVVAQVIRKGERRPLLGAQPVQSWAGGPGAGGWVVVSALGLGDLSHPGNCCSVPV